MLLSLPSNLAVLRSHGPKTYAWISLWFLLTAPLMIWDAGYGYLVSWRVFQILTFFFRYCLMRPRSMVGGDLYWFWQPYEQYGMVDHVYGAKAFEDGDGFASAAGMFRGSLTPNIQLTSRSSAILNLLETFANIAYLIGTHVYETRAAPLVGYTGATATLAKTILYSLTQYFCNGCAVGHNTSLNLFVFWIFPNIMWIVFPGFIMWRLGSDMMISIGNASEKSKTS
ncbi:hypothetical protein B0H13DRAFT_2660497 [Mycena leptocephala]|nr:hypothetical protein B0H13DRAFT_2660497 [Mycena leptocephala]